MNRQLNDCPELSLAPHVAVTHGTADRGCARGTLSR